VLPYSVQNLNVMKPPALGAPAVAVACPGASAAGRASTAACAAVAESASHAASYKRATTERPITIHPQHTGGALPIFRKGPGKQSTGRGMRSLPCAFMSLRV
jgi:hypothetical protein